MFQWDLLECSVWNSVEEYVLYLPACYLQEPLLRTCLPTGSDLVFMWLVSGFRPLLAWFQAIAESILTLSFLGLAPRSAEVINFTFRLLAGRHFQLCPGNPLKSCRQTLLLGDQERRTLAAGGLTCWRISSPTCMCVVDSH